MPSVTFDIRNFLHQLTPNKREKNKYTCPACGRHNLSVEPKTGKYQCFNGCANDVVREAINPWENVKNNKLDITSPNPQVIAKETNKNISNKISCIENAEFSKITNLSETERYIDFFYDTHKFVRRNETFKDGVWKKTTVTPWYWDSTQNTWINKKGDGFWTPYKIEDISTKPNDWILFVEGEKCVEYARKHFRLNATTVMGSSWGVDDLKASFEFIKSVGVAGIIMFPDNDPAGYNKAAKCKQICEELKIPFIQLDPIRIWADIPEGGDIADYFRKYPKSGKEKLYKIIQSSIDSYNVQQLDPVAKAIQGSFERDMPKIREVMKQYTATQDPLQQTMLKNWLLQQGFAANIVDSILGNANALPRKAPTIMTGAEFNNYQFPTSGWIYPELLIDCGVQLISGLPGAMKTTFAYDMMFHYLNGLPFLGEELSREAKSGRRMGLIINSDQQSREMQAYTKNAPLAVQASKDGRYHVIGGNPDEEKWTIKYLPWLERQVAENQYSLIIIDSYNAIHSHLPDWNENLSTAAQAINALRAIAEKYNCAIIVIHHDGKREDGSATIKTRGNTAIPGAASAVMSLVEPKEDRNGNRDPLIRFLEISKLRGAATSKMVIKYDPVARSFNAMPDGSPTNRSTLNNIANNLYNTKFNSTNEYLFPELLKSFQAGVTGDRQLFLARVLGKLEQRGVIEKVMKGECYYRYKPPINQVPMEEII